MIFSDQVAFKANFSHPTMTSESPSLEQAGQGFASQSEREARKAPGLRCDELCPSYRLNPVSAFRIQDQVLLQFGASAELYG